MRCILVILDGLGDRGHPALAGKTPLAAARTPNLDRLARLGLNGLYHPWLQGTALPSEIAHFLMFGYDLAEFPGRGYIEALGAGIPVAEGEVAVLARILAVREQEGLLVLISDNPSADQETCLALQKQIRTFSQEGIEVEFSPTGGIKGVVRLRGRVSADITDSNPIYQGRPLMEVVPLEEKLDDEGARRTARVLNSYLKWCYATLSPHPLNRKRTQNREPPLNAVGTQRAGMKKEITPFPDKWGLKALAIASGTMYRGLSRYFGMDFRPLEDTDNPGEDLLARLKLAREAPGYDFMYVHTKAPDEAAHTKDPLIKQQVLQSLDRAFSYALEEIIPDPETLLVITADHATNSAGEMIHSGDTVPLTMIGKYPRVDDVSRFDEISCARGGLGQVRGEELMHLILNFLDRGKLVGLRDSPHDRPYFPSKYRPLDIS